MPKKHIAISDREHAGMVLATLRAVDVARKQLALEQAGEGAGDDAPMLSDPSLTYKQRRVQLDEKAANIEREYSSIMPLVRELNEPPSEGA